MTDVARRYLAGRFMYASRANPRGELVEALRKASDRKTREARSG